jgi:hypothetical protein
MVTVHFICDFVRLPTGIFLVHSWTNTVSFMDYLTTLVSYVVSTMKEGEDYGQVGTDMER